jgi:peptidoglycan/LPS O-acetylase OafA/YrhL
MIYQIVCSPDRETLFQTLRTFYKRRFYRLAPALIVTLLGSLILLILFASSSDLKKSGLQALYTLGFAGNIGAFRLAGDYFHNNGNPLIHTWSLSIEEQIYFALPVIFVLLYFVWKKVNQRFFFVLFALTLLSFLSWIDFLDTSSVYSRIGIRDVSSFSFYSPIERFWQFGIGGVCSGFLLKVSEYPRRGFKKIYLLLLPSLALFVTQLNSGNDEVNTLIVVIIMCALLLGIPNFSFKLPVSRVMVGIGNRSYSIYLVHMPLVYLAINSPWLDTNSVTLQLMILLAGITLTFLLAEIMFRKVENAYRINEISGKDNSQGKNKIFSIIILLALLSSFMIHGKNTSYFGMQEALPKIAKAWEMDPNCERMGAWDSPPCIYQTQGAAKTLLLIGDSHAAQFSQVFVDAGKTENWNVVIWTMAGCAVVFERNVSQISNDCLEHNLRVSKWIEQNLPSLVVVSQYNGSFLPQQDIREAILRIKQYADEVLVIGNTPVFKDKRFMTHPALFQEAYTPRTFVRSNEIDRTHVEVSKKFVEWVRSKGLIGLNLNELWCSDSGCTRKDYKDWLFFDRDHLSLQGASYFRPQLQNILSQLKSS